MSIVWLASYPKSGNTWLRKFLQAYVLGPPFRLNEAHPLFRGDLNRHDYQLISCEPLTRIDFPAQIHLRPAALWNMVQQAGPKKRIYVKTHHCLQRQLGIDLIPKYLSDGAIYLVRDPRDVVLSYAHHFGEDIDTAIDHIANTTNTILDRETVGMYHGIGDWAGHVRTWTVDDHDIPRLIVTYERMVRYPHSTFRQIIKFLGLEYNQERFNHALGSTRFANLRRLEDERGFVERSQHNNQFFRKGRTGEWREVLTGEQVRRIEDAHGDMMTKFGYLDDAQAAAA